MFGPRNGRASHSRPGFLKGESKPRGICFAGGVQFFITLCSYGPVISVAQPVQNLNGGIEAQPANFLDYQGEKGYFLY
jgi:hypothetical protein